MLRDIYVWYISYLYLHNVIHMIVRTKKKMQTDWYKLQFDQLTREQNNENNTFAVNEQRQQQKQQKNPYAKRRSSNNNNKTNRPNELCRVVELRLF